MTSRNPGSLEFPGCGSRDAPSSDRCLHTGVLPCCALDPWRRGDEFYSTFFEKHRQIIAAQLSFRLGLCSLPGQPPMADVLEAQLSRFFDLCLLSHWRYPQSVLGQWCLRQYALQRSLPTGSHGHAPTAGWPFVSLELFSSNWSNSLNSQT